MYANLDFAKYTKTTLDVDNTLANAVLENSHGHPVMSAEDTKIAIVSLLNTCKRQQEIIDELVSCVNEQRNTKKKFWTRKK